MIYLSHNISIDDILHNDIRKEFLHPAENRPEGGCGKDFESTYGRRCSVKNQFIIRKFVLRTKAEAESEGGIHYGKKDTAHGGSLLYSAGAA